MQGSLFRVDGADLETGEETYLVLQAASSSDAEQIARKQGLLIAAVRAATAADWGADKSPRPPVRSIVETIVFETLGQTTPSSAQPDPVPTVLSEPEPLNVLPPLTAAASEPTPMPAESTLAEPLPEPIPASAQLSSVQAIAADVFDQPADESPASDDAAPDPNAVAAVIDQSLPLALEGADSISVRAEEAPASAPVLDEPGQALTVSEPAAAKSQDDADGDNAKTPAPVQETSPSIAAAQAMPASSDSLAEPLLSFASEPAAPTTEHPDSMLVEPARDSAAAKLHPSEHETAHPDGSKTTATDAEHPVVASADEQGAAESPADEGHPVPAVAFAEDSAAIGEQAVSATSSVSAVDDSVAAQPLEASSDETPAAAALERDKDVPTLPIPASDAWARQAAAESKDELSSPVPDSVGVPPVDRVYAVAMAVASSSPEGAGASGADQLALVSATNGSAGLQPAFALPPVAVVIEPAAQPVVYEVTIDVAPSMAAEKPALDVVAADVVAMPTGEQSLRAPGVVNTVVQSASQPQADAAAPADSALSTAALPGMAPITIQASSAAAAKATSPAADETSAPEPSVESTGAGAIASLRKLSTLDQTQGIVVNPAMTPQAGVYRVSRERTPIGPGLPPGKTVVTFAAPLTPHGPRAASAHVDEAARPPAAARLPERGVFADLPMSSDIASWIASAPPEAAALIKAHEAVKPAPASRPDLVELAQPAQAEAWQTAGVRPEELAASESLKASAPAASASAMLAKEQSDVADGLSSEALMLAEAPAERAQRVEEAAASLSAAVEREAPLKVAMHRDEPALLGAGSSETGELQLAAVGAPGAAETESFSEIASASHASDKSGEAPHRGNLPGGSAPAPRGPAAGRPGAMAPRHGAGFVPPRPAGLAAPPPRPASVPSAANVGKARPTPAAAPKRPIRLTPAVTKRIPPSLTPATAPAAEPTPPVSEQPIPPEPSTTVDHQAESHAQLVPAPLAEPAALTPVTTATAAEPQLLPPRVQAADTAGAPHDALAEADLLPPQPEVIRAAETIYISPEEVAKAAPHGSASTTALTPMASPSSRAARATWSPLAAFILLPFGLGLTGGGATVLVLMFLRLLHAGAGQADKIDFRLQTLMQTMLGGFALLSGLLLFATASLIQAWRTLRMRG